MFVVWDNCACSRFSEDFHCFVKVLADHLMIGCQVHFKLLLLFHNKCLFYHLIVTMFASYTQTSCGCCVLSCFFFHWNLHLLLLPGNKCNWLETFNTVSRKVVSIHTWVFVQKSDLRWKITAVFTITAQLPMWCNPGSQSDHRLAQGYQVQILQWQSAHQHMHHSGPCTSWQLGMRMQVYSHKKL